MKTCDDLQTYITSHGIQARLINKPATHSTADACAALCRQGVRVDLGQFIKALVLVGFGGDRTVLAMVAGPDQVDLKAVERIVGHPVRLPTPDQAQAICSYPRGGTPPFGLSGIRRYVMDSSLLEPPRLLYGGGGDPQHVVELHSHELLRHLENANGPGLLIVACVARVAKEAR